MRPDRLSFITTLILTAMILSACAKKPLVFPGLDTTDKAAVGKVVEQVGDDPHEWFVVSEDLLLII